MKSIGIKGTGIYLPENILTNKDLERMVDTTDEWITERTGIKQRRIAADWQAASDLAVLAAKEAIKDANIKPSDIDGIIVATITPDMVFPNTACLVAQKLGLKNIPAFDISAACSGFTYGLEIARQLIRGGICKTMLLVASEVLSRITDWQDRNTCILFGDGAGASILQKVEEGYGILKSYLSADGRDDVLYLPAGGSRMPASFDTVNKRLHYMKMNGREVFRFAIDFMYEAVIKILENTNISINDITLLIPHQANLRIIKILAKKLNFPEEKVFINLDKYGNVSAASCIIALHEAVKSGKIRRGDLVILVSFGGGFTWAANLIRWCK